MSFFWPEGQLIIVTSDSTQTPQAFTWDNQTHPVAQIAKRWRYDGGWWQQRAFRDYFKLTTETGLLVIIFLDWLSGQWYLQRLYD